MDQIGNYFRNNTIIKNGYWNLEIADPYFKKNDFIVNIEIKNLTNSLLFSLIPLHKENKDNCKLFYKLIR